MRIEGTNAVPSAQPAGGKVPQGRSSPTDQPAGTEIPISEDPEIRHRVRKHLEEASATEETDRRAIDEARDLLKSGKLDTPDAVARAAEAIVDLGT